MKKLLLSLIITLLLSSQALALTTTQKVEFTYYSPEDQKYYAVTTKDKEGCRYILETNKKEYKKLKGKKVLIDYREYKAWKGEYYIYNWKVIK